MAGGLRDSSLTRVRPFFGGLIAQDPKGGSWFEGLLAATPHGKAVFADLLRTRVRLTRPWYSPELMACSDASSWASAPGDLLGWYVEHPDELDWPRNRTYSETATKMRRALLYDSAQGGLSRRVRPASWSRRGLLNAWLVAPRGRVHDRLHIDDRAARRSFTRATSATSPGGRHARRWALTSRCSHRRPQTSNPPHWEYAR